MIKTNLPSIAKIKKENPKLANEVIAELMLDYIEFVNIGKNMNVKQIAQTSGLILQYFPHLNLADLRLFFDKMKLGHYGNNYDAVDGQKMLLNLESYNQDRMNEFEIIKNSQHNEIKKQEKQMQYHPNVVEALKKAVGDREYIKNFAPGEDKPKTQSELLIQRWTKQFDSLYHKFGLFKGVRYLKINNQLFTFDKFIERKFENYES